MTIRGTSNQTINTREDNVVSEGYEVGPNVDGGGAGNSNAGSVEYREVDNNPIGVSFVKANKHLPDGNAQVTDDTPPP